MSERSHDEEWVADFATVELLQLRAMMRLTPEQRLRWLEEAVQFAKEAGALPRKESDRQ